MKANFLAVIVIVCAVLFFVLALFVVLPQQKTVEIGPNSPYLWGEEEKILGEGDIFLESKIYPITVYSIDENIEKQYATQTIAGETPIGQNPTFYGQFTANDKVLYTTDGPVSIYTKSSMELKVIYHPTELIWYLIILILIIVVCSIVLNITQRG